jgi:cysteine-rich repeat protein
MSRRASVLLSLVALLVPAVPPARAWLTNLANTPPVGRPFGLGVDAQGNVLTAGRTPSGPGGTSDGIAAKLAATSGAPFWQRLVVGSGNGNDIVRAQAVDAAGNLVVIGQVQNTTTNADAMIAKLAASNGDTVWMRSIDSGTNGSDDARAGALLAGGDVIAAGQSPAPGNPDPIAVWRLAADTGTTVWTRRIPGTGGVAQRVAVDGNAVYVAAHVPVSGGTRLVVARIDAASGDVVWNQTVVASGGNDDAALGLAVRAGSHVVLLAHLHSGATAPDFTVVAFHADDGAEAWRTTLDGGAAGADDADAPRALAVTPDGDVVATGVLSTILTFDDWVTVKLRGSDGHELWRTAAYGSAAGAEDSRDVAVDANGDVLSAGRLRNAGDGGDLSVVKLAGSSGTQIWQQNFDGTSDGNDTAFNVAVDAGNNVAATGRLGNGPGQDGYAVVRLSGASGGSLPCGNAVGDPGEECDDGNPVLGDGCRTDCTREVCGDGRLDPQETCDDGNLVDGDCCSATCVVSPDGTPCDDGDVCTAPDECTAGECVGTSEVDCSLDEPCRIGLCDQEAGGCVIAVLANGTRCNDGDACTIADRCGDGVCVGGPPPFCDDNDPCTNDGCTLTDGCVHPAVSGFPSVLCVFERRTIPFECRNPLPVPLANKLEQTEHLLSVASVEQRTKTARRMLKRAGSAARKAQRLATRGRDGGLIPFHCGQAVVDEMVFLRARISALRIDLR